MNTSDNNLANSNIDTGGGGIVGGDVQAGGNFIGRDHVDVTGDNVSTQIGDHNRNLVIGKDINFHLGGFTISRWVWWLLTTGILVGIVTLLTIVIVNISDIRSTTSLPNIDLTATANTSKILWEKNWQQVKNRFQGAYCCPEGKTITNREKYLTALNGLELTSDTEMQNDLEDLIVLIEKAEPYPDSNWNMVLTDEIEAAFDRLINKIRNRAIENGVNVNE